MKTIQPEGVKEKERTTPLQIGFDETQHDILDEHPTFLDDVQEYYCNTAPTSLWMPSLCFTKGKPKWKESNKVAG
jgi:hypothetical protein